MNGHLRTERIGIALGVADVVAVCQQDRRDPGTDDADEIHIPAAFDTNAATIMVGEKASDLIRGSHA
ncbi:hypothetical protein [Nocardia sp. NPDC004604]|uniref:hypothetical protein n=1 Tax=Nocardia sp. NPDC004604 TaxID=3157013 RepID=UPI0033B7AB1A